MILCCLAGLVVLSSCKEREEVEQNAEEPLKVSIITVRRGGESGNGRYVGHVSPKRSITLNSRCSGTLVSLPVRKGQKIAKGQTVAVIHSQRIESALGTARANLKQAQDAYDRIRKVYSEGGVSEVQMVDIDTKLAKAREAEASAAKALEDCTIKAPYSGVISEVQTDCGVELTLGAAIATIIDVSELKLLISVHENDINEMTAGLNAKVEIPALNLLDLDAVMTEKNMLSSAMSHSYECTFALKERIPELMPGMAVKIRIEARENDNIIIPAAAVQLDTQSQYVWVCDSEGTVRKARIRVGGYAGKGVIVSEGLKEGDRVITEGYQKVSTGMKVVEK